MGTSSWADPGFVKEWYPPRSRPGSACPGTRERFGRSSSTRASTRSPTATTCTRLGRGHARRLHLRRQGPPRAVPPLGAARLAAAGPARRAETNERGRVILTPELESALAERLVEETAPLDEAGKLGAFLAAADPGLLPRQARAGRARRPGGGARPARPGDRAAQPQLGRGRAARARRSTGSPTAAWRSSAWTRRPADNFQIMPPTGRRHEPDDLAYMRAHGRNTEGLPDRQVGGRALRLAVHGRRARGDRGPRARAGGEARARCTWRSTTTAATTRRRRRSASARCSGRRPREPRTLRLS